MHYSIKERTDNIAGTLPQRHDRASQLINKITLRQLSEDVAMASALDSEIVENVVLNLIDTVTHYLKGGRNIEFDEYCSLHLSFTTGDLSIPEITEDRIKKMNIVLTPGKRLVNQWRDSRFNLYK